MPAYRQGFDGSRLGFRRWIEQNHVNAVMKILRIRHGLHDHQFPWPVRASLTAPAIVVLELVPKIVGVTY
jgi:hypothetical protein